MLGKMESPLWHEDENAVYEVDYECMKQKHSVNYMSTEKDEKILNYFVLLVSMYLA